MKQRYRSRSRDKRDRYHHDRHETRRHNNQRERRERSHHKKYNDRRSHHSPQKQPIEINRSEVCPFYTRIFYTINDENDYSKLKSLPPDPSKQLALYLWQNSSLKEITELIRAHLPHTRTKKRFQFSKVSQHRPSTPQPVSYVKREMGTVMVHKKSEDEEDKTLAKSEFNIGDCIDVSIYYK